MPEAEAVLSKARPPKPGSALKALDMVILKALPGLLTPEVRGLWRDRLLQLMYLYETQGRPQFVAAAATAAEALGPHGRVMGQHIGFVKALLRRSAVRFHVRW